MPNPYKILREAFEFNILLVRALLHLIPHPERKLLILWMNKLTTQCDSPEEMSLKNEYVWYLLVMLQSGTIGAPFNKPPPVGRLPELVNTIPRSIYKELLETSLENYEKPDEDPKMAERSDEDTGQDGEKKCNEICVNPAEFFDWQPKPSDGSFCYACVFSNYEC